MTRLTLFVILFCAAAFGANFKLYLKDGTWHAVREYKVESDRVRYYSIERSDWEEIPAELVDLKKTESEIKDRDETEKREKAESAAEEKAEREAEREIARIPQDAGAYLSESGQLKPLKVAEAKVVNNKRRSVLKALSPIPMVSGKATLELDGPAAPVAVEGDAPEFYFRLQQAQRFGIIRLSPGKENSRVVEKITIVPVTNEMVEEPEEVEIFRRQVGDLLYKIWPQQPLPAGEYALVEYTPGKVNPVIYDFSVRNGKAGSAPAAPASKSSKKDAKPKGRSAGK